MLDATRRLREVPMTTYAPRLGGPTAIVTGGASGIGAATVRILATKGVQVAVFDRDGAAAHLVATEQPDLVGQLSAYDVDARDVAAIDAAVAAVRREHGQVDYLVNSAGITGARAPLWETTPEQFDEVIATDLRSVWAMMRAVIPLMRAAGSGAIVNVASTAGLIGYRDKSPYTAAKHGVVGLTKVAALECRDRGVRVNCVCPGTVATPLIRGDATVLSPAELEASLAARAAAQPTGRFGTPEEIAEVIVFLLDSTSSFVNGAALAVDGSLLAGAVP